MNLDGDVNTYGDVSAIILVRPQGNLRSLDTEKLIEAILFQY